MDSRTFQSHVLSACNQYLSYLEQSRSAGKSFNPVTDFSRYSKSDPYLFQLQLSQPLRYPESSYFQIYGQQIDDRKISIVQYDGKRSPRQLLVRVSAEYYSEFISLSPEEILVVSDFSFLIRRLRSFYADVRISLMPPALDVSPKLCIPDTLTLPQKNAVECALSNAVSYIWGPPGTGKTRYVLSSCILHYVLKGKRVLLLAPTNNAIEQVLYGLMPVLETQGIPRAKVCRIGIASDKFASVYPELVENRELAQRYDDANAEVSRLKNELATQKSIVSAITLSEQDLLSLKKECAYASDAVKDVEVLLSQLAALDAKSEASREALGEYPDVLEQFDEAENKLATRISFLDSQLSSLQRKRRFLSVVPFTHRQKESLSAQLLELNKDKSAVLAELKKNHAEANKTRARFEKERSRFYRFKQELETLYKRKADILSFALNKCKNQNLLNILSDLQDDVFSDRIYQKIKDCYSSAEKKHTELVKTRSLRSLQDIESDLKEQMQILSTLSDSVIINQRRNALVLACTVDSSLRFLSSDERSSFSHVFLDEAGYASVVRGMVPFCCGCPVTFLGDHFQIPPIFEKNTIDETEMPLCLWSLPVAYYANLISGCMGDLYEIYQSLRSSRRTPIYPVCDQPEVMAFSPLSESYRFSDSLAEILNRYIYNTDFVGRSEQSFEVIILDAPDFTPNERRSRNEALAIAKYISDHLNASDSFAIFAPYNAQVKEIRRCIPSIHGDSVLTVHRSQGQEYDTVIFSATDTTQKFFVDSTCAQGKSVLNTAISRTRQRLVIACDVTYWSKHPGQLLYDLIRIGKVYAPPLHCLK